MFECKDRCTVYYKVQKMGRAKTHVYCPRCCIWIKKSEIGNEKRCRCCNFTFRHLYKDFCHKWRNRRETYNKRIDASDVEV